MIEIEKLLPPMLSGDRLIKALEYFPDYDEDIRNMDMSDRLAALSNLYKIYYPFQMSVEIYHKLYLATAMGLKKKGTKLAVEQRNDNYRAMIGDKEYHGIIGGADSMSIIGASGIGKSSAIQQAINSISGGRVIEIDNPYSKIIPCLQVQCPFDASPKGMLLEILRNVDKAIDTNYYERSRKSSDTTDILIGTVSQVLITHVSTLIVDEIQNVYGRKLGTSLVAMLIQLINSSGVSIVLVGTPECISFFESSVQIARRGQGLIYSALPYDERFEDFCRKIWNYQYVINKTQIDTGIIDFLFEHSGGNIAAVISLLHDAQESAILQGEETVNYKTLNRAYKDRMTFLHKYINTAEKVVHPKIQPSVSSLEEMAIQEYLSLEDMVKDAKKREADIVEYLEQRICVEEVVAG